MPGHVLTFGSVIGCGHPGGKLSFLAPTQTKLKVAGSFALLLADVQAATVSGCTIQTTQTTITCAKVLAVTGGQATKLRVNALPVMLAESLVGTTNGLSAGKPGSLTITSLQTSVQQKLTAI